MARISEEMAAQYEKSGNKTEWFSLKDDGDVARVQFMWNSPEDIEIHTVHNVEVNGKNRYLNCLRSYEDPLDKCPMCASGDVPKVERFVVLYQLDDQKVKIWGRGVKFIEKIKGLMNRYSPLPKKVFDIERRGKRGDQKTDYEVWPVDEQPVDLAEVEYPELLGGIILDKTAEDMEEYLRTGEFPTHDAAPSPQLPSRRAAPTAPSRRSSRRAIDPSATGANKEVF